MFTVTMNALVSGDPRKAWDEDTEPDDVWEDGQRHDFNTLDEAKGFVQAIIDTPGMEHTTTHVEIEQEDGLVLYRKDAGDVLDDTQEGVIAASLYVAPPSEDDRSTPLPTIADISSGTVTEEA